jgi:hypothetical protein
MPATWLLDSTSVLLSFCLPIVQPLSAWAQGPIVVTLRPLNKRGATSSKSKEPSCGGPLAGTARILSSRIAQSSMRNMATGRLR